MNADRLEKQLLFSIWVETELMPIMREFWGYNGTR